MNGIVGKVAIGIAGAGMAVAVAAVAVGDRVGDWYEKHRGEQAGYATGSEAKAGGRAVPSWLPDDASDVRYLRAASGGDRLLTAVLPEGRLPAGCTVTEAGQGASATVRLKAGWFPPEAARRPTGTCGHYKVTLNGNRLYAWQDGAAVQAAQRGGRPVGR